MVRAKKSRATDEGDSCSKLYDFDPFKDKKKLEILCSDLAELALQASRRQLRACLKLRTALGKYVNKEIYARTGVRMGSGIKGKDVLEELMGGALGIRQFTQEDAQSTMADGFLNLYSIHYPMPVVSARSLLLVERRILNATCP